MNGWRKRKVIVLATKRSYDQDYTEYLSLGVLSRTNWYISLFLSWDSVVVLVGVLVGVGVRVVIFVVSTQYLIYTVICP